MQQESYIDRQAGKLVVVLALIHFLAFCIGVTLLALNGQWLWLLAVIPAIVISYNISLVLFGSLLGLVLWHRKPAEYLEEIQLERIKLLNQRIAEGLDSGPELDALIAAAGLEPLHIPVAYGPVIGKLGDAELYEWVDAKRGTSGEVERYVYEGRAQVDADNVLIIPDQTKQYMAIDGILYSRT